MGDVIVPITKWEEGLVVDYAMMKASEIEGRPSIYSMSDIAATWAISIEQLIDLEKNPEFFRQARAEMMVIKKTCPHIALKASAILEHWLDTKALYWLEDTDNTSDRVKVLDQIIKISGLIEKNKATEVAQNPANILPTLNIVLSTPAAVCVEKIIN